MSNIKKYAKFQENLFSSNEVKSIFCPPLFRKRPIACLILLRVSVCPRKKTWRTHNVASSSVQCLFAVLPNDIAFTSMQCNGVTLASV